MAPDTLAVVQVGSPGTWAWLKSSAPAIGTLGTFFALLFGLWQYRRAERWRRGEFAAREIKEFNDDHCVQLAQMLIDWGDRKVNLFDKPNPGPRDLVHVTRETQWRALVPHTLKDKEAYRSRASRGGDSDPLAWFTLEEARIRDVYDDFLFYLNRFHHFIESRLLRSRELAPYLRYWIEEIASEPPQIDKPSVGDHKWRCALIGFIYFYRYDGVVKLFDILGHRIDRDSKCWKNLEETLKGDPLLEDLKKHVRGRHEERVAAATPAPDPAPA
jgi:hypothetical protein